MCAVFWIILIFAVLIACLLLVKVRFIACISESERYAAVKIGFFKINLYPQKKQDSASCEGDDEKKIHDDDKKTEESIGNFKDLWYNNGGNIKKTLLRLKKRILVENLSFEYSCGFADAAVTAIMYGTVHALYCSIFKFFDRHFKVKNMSGDISADFNTKKKHIAVNCILRLSIADIIYIFAAILPILKNNK